MRTFLAAWLLVILVAAPTFASDPQRVKLVDEVGPLTILPPPIGTSPKQSESSIAPGITKEFRFVAPDGSAAVIISTKIRPDLPKDDRVLERIKPRYDRLVAEFGDDCQLRMLGEAPRRILEFGLGNSDYTELFPQALGQTNASSLRTLGITQIFVTEGRMIECALHLPNTKSLPPKEFIAEARKTCTAWRESLKVESR